MCTAAIRAELCRVLLEVNMRLSDLYLQFRRQRSVVVQAKEQPTSPRQTLTLEAMTRPAQIKSLKAARRQR